MSIDRLRQLFGKAFPVNGECTSSRNRVSVCRCDKEAVAPPQLFLQEAYRVMHAGAAQTVGANQFTEAIALMGRGHTLRAHFEKLDRDPPAGNLPGGFTAGQAGTDNGDRSHDRYSG